MYKSTKLICRVIYICHVEQICSRCKISHPIERFYKRSSRPSGFRSECKECTDKATYLYYEKNLDRINTRRREHIQNNNERINTYRRRYWHDNNEYLNMRKKEWRAVRKTDVLLKVGRGELKCVNCSCNVVRCLQINHINGGGRKEIKLIKDARRFYDMILSGERTIDDLNLLCGVCNWMDHMERKLGYKGAWKVTWYDISCK